MIGTRRALPAGSTFGEIVHQGRVGELVLTEATTPTGVTTPVHSHERAYFQLILEGRWSEVCGPLERSLEPWLVIYHPSGEYHHNEFRVPAGRNFLVELTDDWLDRMGQNCFDRGSPLESRSPAVVRSLLRLLQELTHLDRWSPMTVEGLLLEAASGLGRDDERRHHTSPPAWLGRLESALREGCASTLSLTGLAEWLGTHPSVLTRVFRRHYGCVPSEFVRRLRVERAAVALTSTDCCLAEVALKHGFADQSHLTRVFRRYTGVTPGAYRRRASSLPPGVQPVLP